MAATSLTTRLGELGLVPALAGASPLFAPESADQAAELLGTCAREGWRVRLQGAGTRSDTAPADADVVVSARALTGFDVYEPDDLTVGIRAGTTHTATERELARHQQLLTLDHPGTEGATIGGSFASGQAGPLRAGYGTPRDLALGLTLVTGDGRLLRLGGQVVKNVAGYDLVRLVVGSRGTLGLITQLFVRLRSLPPSDITVLAEVADRSRAAELALRIRDLVAPVALELLSPSAATPAWRLATRLHGSADVTAAAVALLQRAALPDARALAAEEATALWRALAAAEAAATARLRCAALPGSLPGLLTAAVDLLNLRSDNGMPLWQGAAHAPDGILRLWTAEPRAQLARAPAAPLQDLAAGVASVNGTCICVTGPDNWRALLPGPAAAPRLLELERELRLRFDPGAILVGS